MEQTLTQVEAPKKKGTGTKLVVAILILFVAVILLIVTQSTKILPHTMLNVPTGISAASAMTMTEFDRQLARQMMDKDNDGQCDACGMPVDLCIDSGQLQCNMDPKSTIGILGSQHIHADFKVYVNSKPLDFSDKAHMERMQAGQPVSSFIHVDSGAPAPEKTGDILHMHATGIPLQIFFKSIGVELPTGTQAYVNGKEISDWQNYVFNDLDKILITNSIDDLQMQLNSVTDFAKDH